MVFDWYDVLAALSAVSASAYVLFVALFFFGIRRALRPHEDDPTPPAQRPRPPVTILKPCAGVDDQLEECLESFCKLDYPRYQIVFGVRDIHDAAYPIITRLKDRHPEIDIEIALTTAGQSPNPKVANLEVMAGRAKYDLFWISDSNTRVHPDTLTTLVDDMERSGASAVVSPVAGVGEMTAGATLENLQLSTYVVMMSYAIYGVSRRVTLPGKSTLVRRESLEAVGGFIELGRYCAEDFILLEKLRARGERAVVGRRLVANVNAGGTVRRCLDRHLRWAQLRWLVTPATTVLEPLVSPMVPALALLMAAPSANSAAIFAGAALLQMAGDVAVVFRLRGSGFALRHLFFVWARPMMIVWLWARSAFNRKVVWRGNVRWIGPNSTILNEAPIRARLRAIRNAVARY